MFTLKLEEVDFEKIERFCQEKVPEGETIEYKGDFPSNLEKSISAMANTYGGIILIGVEADKTTNTPVLPIKGRELEKGLEEKVTSICLRKIYHPYFPLVKVCPFKNEKGEDKCVVFIRVYESDQMHAINNNTDVYFRIKSQNEPFRKATVDEVEWLKNRRQKAVENREKLLRIADQRFESMPYDQLDQLKVRETHKDLHSSYRKVSIIPLFPIRPLLDYLQLLNLKDAYYRWFDNVVFLGKPISSSGSLSFPLVHYDDSKSPKYLNNTEFNIWGLIYNKQSLWENSDPENRDLFHVSYFLKQIHRVVTVGRSIYEKAGYFGSALIDVEVGGILGKQIGVDNLWFKNKIEPHVNITRTCTFGELNENLENIIIDICTEFLWCCGVGERVRECETDLKNLYKREKDSFQ
ncbi:MAG: hypothetical protein AMJ89_04540 [candidate division Zixibacteria bacterium SM23_73]|nr:MAG: hypothetical protein AMJ89_04540 [candidate division Zixibacteria bacterium SM23_73]